MNGRSSIKRGDIFLVQFDPVIGSEQGKTRPAIIIQNDEGNKYSPVTIVAAITSKKYSKDYPTNVFITPEESGLKHDSTILLNQIRTVDKQRLIVYLTHLDKKIMEKVNKAIKVNLGLG